MAKERLQAVVAVGAAERGEAGECEVELLERLRVIAHLAVDIAELAMQFRLGQRLQAKVTADPGRAAREKLARRELVTLGHRWRVAAKEREQERLDRLGAVRLLGRGPCLPQRRAGADQHDREQRRADANRPAPAHRETSQAVANPTIDGRHGLAPREALELSGERLDVRVACGGLAREAFPHDRIEFTAQCPPQSVRPHPSRRGARLRDLGLARPTDRSRHQRGVQRGTATRERVGFVARQQLE